MKRKELLAKGSEILKLSGIEYYKEDAMLLLGFVLDCDNLSIIINGEEFVEDKKETLYLKNIEKRSQKYPVKYILGKAEFMGLDFYVKEGVLIPRADTETLVEEVIKIINVKNYKSICDVCSGSGAIGLSIAYICQNVKVDLCDISDKAKEVTTTNLDQFNLQKRAKFYHSDLLEFAVKENKKYDVIVSNPPYIRTEEINNLMKDVKEYEPHLALDGKEDGLFFYEKITNQSIGLLNDGGLLAYEIGFDQKVEVEEIMRRQGFEGVYTLKDFGGNDRVVIGYYKKK